MVYQGGELEGKQGEVCRVKSTDVGQVLQILDKVFTLVSFRCIRMNFCPPLAQVGDPLHPGQAILHFQLGCARTTVMPGAGLT